ncbi:hypothetical protein FOZ63_017102 [Perkinsus olseni]|uniref:Calmodulin n=1 Tax=Perkinsus olseni TaxID=32597 RepID=A0A7J6P8P1_PEROL|nr:hypothetical protein FOZ60_013414 [Perkinsus olseni]KAF4727707.1 hypothetical protein FOZ62_017403 [Perkinsus olseni]KAF4739329.1 hypothetical protein FOZ63_017102 [Perkinsus olseni]
MKKHTTTINLPPDLIEEYRKAFSLVDRGGRGVITPYEIGVLMRSLGHSPTDDELIKILEDYDLSNRKGITVDEFLEVMSRRENSVELRESLSRAFQLFDRDGNGFLSVQELRDKLCSSGDNPYSEKEFDDLLAGAEVTSDGQLEYSQLVEMMLRKA